MGIEIFLSHFLNLEYLVKHKQCIYLFHEKSSHYESRNKFQIS